MKNSPRLTPRPPPPLLTLPCRPRGRLYLTSLLSPTVLIRSLKWDLVHQTSLHLCLRGSGGEDRLLLPRPWRLLLHVTPTSLTSELPRMLPLPLTSPRPCHNERTGDGLLGLTLHHHHHLPLLLPLPLLHNLTLPLLLLLRRI